MASLFAPAPSMAPPRVPRGRRPAIGSAIETWLEAERDQLALWLPTGLALGIAMWFWLPDRESWIAFLASMAFVALVTLPGWRHLRAARLVGSVALATLIGCALIWVRADWIAAPRLERPTVATFTAKILRVEPQPAKGSVRVRLAPISVEQPDRHPEPVAGSTRPPATRSEGSPSRWMPEQVQHDELKLPPALRVTIADADIPKGLATGAVIKLRARLLEPAPPMAPGGYDFARVAWFDRLGAAGKALPGVTLVSPAHPAGWRERLDDWRARLSTHIESKLKAGEGGFATALVTGDVGGLPQSDSDALRRSGLAHLLSVSGLHVTAVIAAVMLVTMRLLALSPRLALRAPLPLFAAGAGALAGIGYTLLSGAEVPTIRSCVASLLVLAGVALGREAMTLRLVAAAAGILMLLWPEALAGPSFQLSFAAVISIVALHESPRVRALVMKRDEAIPRRLLREMVALLATGLVVEAALMPIGLFHFHRAGLYGSVANLVAIPLTTFVIMPLEALALVLDIFGLGAPMWWVAGKAIGLLLWIAHTVAAAPGAVMMLPTMPGGAYALIAAGGLWLALWRTRPRWLGLLPILAGLAWTLTIPPPDLILTGDGRHLAVRGDGGLLAILRERAGDYVVDTLGETAGIDAGLAFALDNLPGARCSPDSCLVRLVRGGRRWRVLATRSAEKIDADQLSRSCAGVDIVVSDRRLPRTCHPRWLKLTPAVLRATGGVTVTLAGARVRTVNLPGDEHPWRHASATELSSERPMVRSDSHPAKLW